MIDEILERARANGLDMDRELTDRFFHAQLNASMHYDSTRAIHEARQATNRYLDNVIAMYNEGYYCNTEVIM